MNGSEKGAKSENVRLIVVRLRVKTTEGERDAKPKGFYSKSMPEKGIEFRHEILMLCSCEKWKERDLQRNVFFLR